MERFEESWVGKLLAKQSSTYRTKHDQPYNSVMIIIPHHSYEITYKYKQYILYEQCRIQLQRCRYRCCRRCRCRCRCRHRLHYHDHLIGVIIGFYNLYKKSL